MKPVILASTSPSRGALLSATGLAFTAASPGVDETPIKLRMGAEGANGRDIALALAEAKALAISRVTPGLVIGADQTLDVDGQLCDKTETLQETRDRLKQLRGRSHHLFAAVALAEDDRILWRTVEQATLTMRWFSDDFLEDYLVRTGPAVMSSVGAYHLEGLGAQLFDRVDGDYFAVLGLPIMKLLAALRAAGGALE